MSKLTLSIILCMLWLFLTGCNTAISEKPTFYLTPPGDIYRQTGAETGEGGGSRGFENR